MPTDKRVVDNGWKTVTDIKTNLKEGRIIRSKATGEVYLVVGNYGGRATAVKVVDITNPSEWEIFNKNP